MTCCLASRYVLDQTDPEKSRLQELSRANKTPRELQLRRDAERAAAEKGQAGPRKAIGVPVGPESSGL